MLETNYFGDISSHTWKDFRRRFTMNIDLFTHIVYGAREHDDCFKCKKDCTILVGFTSVQKCRAH
jgi:hypothetical protein